jgi:hypothetical protein
MLTLRASVRFCALVLAAAAAGAGAQAPATAKIEA